MKRKDKIKRCFNLVDEVALSEADSKLNSFLVYKQLFVERFPELNDPFADEWKGLICEARQHPPDYYSLAAVTKETAELNKCMKKGRNHYQTILLYARMAFPENNTMLHILGQSDYISSLASHYKLPVLLRKAFKEAIKPEVKTALAGKGLTETGITLLETIAGEIQEQLLVQQGAIKQRKRDTVQRIGRLNLIWGKMALICSCAKLIFQDDIAIYKLFLMPGGSKSK